MAKRRQDDQFGRLLTVTEQLAQAPEKLDAADGEPDAERAWHVNHAIDWPTD